MNTKIKTSDIDEIKMIENIILKDRYFPVKTPILSKTLSKRESEINDIIDKMLDENKLISIAGTDQSEKVIHTSNISIIKDEIIDILSKNQINNPFNNGLTRSEIRKNIAKKKKQKVIDLDLFNYILEQMESVNAIKCVESYISTKKELRYIFKNMIDRGMVCKLREDQYMDKELYQNLKENIRVLILDKGALEIGVLTQELDISRKALVPILEYFDSIGFTKRTEHGRVLQ